MEFSTKDRDNDNAEKHHCAKLLIGGWWYNRCSKTNLNGRYLHGKTDKDYGMTWATWKGFNYSLPSVQMMVREHDTV